jgi:hypothetical protein
MVEAIVIIGGLSLLALIFWPRNADGPPRDVARSFNGRPFGTERD